MNFWDILIVLAVATVVVMGIVSGKRRKPSCHGICSCCDRCPHADGCDNKESPNSK